MSELPSKSPLQFHHLPDGQVQLVGRPDVVLKVHEGQAQAKRPAWEGELGLPTYEEQWDALSIEHGQHSGRFVRFVLCDQSRTKHKGNFPLQPTQIRLQPGNYRFTLGHTGYVIGLCPVVQLHPSAMTRLFRNLPYFVEGDCLVGEAQLSVSGLADIAWRGLQHGIFSHACAVLNQKPDDPDGAGDLVEIALVSQPEAACPGARILKMWEA